MFKLPKKVVDLINDSESIKIVATADEKGNPHCAVKDFFTLLEDGNLAFGEEFEGSTTNVNLVRAVWFDKNVELTIKGKDGATYQIKGKPYKYIYTGDLFKKFYLAARKKWGPDSELAGVWVITPQEVKNETYEVRKKEEDEKHPFFRHLDRASVRKKERYSRRGDLGRPDIYRKNSLRLSNWDYSSPDPYFFTVCTFERREIFQDQHMRDKIIEVFKNVAIESKLILNAIVVATNHIHGIMTLGNGKEINLSEYIGRAKVKVTQTMKGQASLPLRGKIWQRSYYDHVIRDERDFSEKAQYIENHSFKETGGIYAEWH